MRLPSGLRATGRLDDALRRSVNFSEPTGSDLVCLALSHERRVVIPDALGHRADAIVHSRRLVALWRDCDPELRPLRDRAQQRLTSLTRAGASDSPRPRQS
jgi:hypothetical protein